MIDLKLNYAWGTGGEDTDTYGREFPDLPSYEDEDGE